jgi:hypothetical protein
MTTKLLAGILTCLVLLPLPAPAGEKPSSSEPLTKWNWIWSYTAYDPTGHDATFRSWGSMQGEVQFAIRNGRFKTHIVGTAGDPDFYITGSIHGNRVTATILVNETDEPPRRCQGNFDSDFGAKRITFISSSGDFVGFTTQAPAANSAHD